MSWRKVRPVAIEVLPTQELPRDWLLRLVYGNDNRTGLAPLETK